MHHGIPVGSEGNDLLSPFIKWVLGMELRSSGLAAGAFPH